MIKFVIKNLDEREDDNNYLFDSSPRAIDWTSLFYAKKFDTETEAEIYIKKNFILRSQVIAIQVGRWFNCIVYTKMEVSLDGPCISL